MHPLHCLLALLALTGLQEGPAPPPAPAPGAPTAPLARVVCIGASVTDGFGLAAELEAPLRPGDLLRLAAPQAFGSVRSEGSAWFFQAPDETGAKQVDAALAAEATLVVALDFAFWFGYGYAADCDDRAARLERGLRLLERFECPLLVGDLPDMRAALKGSSPMLGGGPLIAPGQVPADECQARLNARLRAWAAEREGVHVFGLRAAAASMRDGGVLEVRGNRYDPERKRGLIQADLLHPTLQGTTALVLLVLDELARLELLDPQRVEWDAARLERRAWDATAETREAKQARRREREARRAKREEQEAPAPSGG